MTTAQTADRTEIAKILDRLAHGFESIADGDAKSAEKRLVAQHRVAVETLARMGEPYFQRVFTDKETDWNNDAIRGLWLAFLEKMKNRLAAQVPSMPSGATVDRRPAQRGEFTDIMMKITPESDPRVAAKYQAATCRWLAGFVKPAAVPKYSRHRRVEEWMMVLKQLGDEISADTFLRRRTGKAKPEYRVNPESTRSSISLAVDDLPTGYTDEM